MGVGVPIAIILLSLATSIFSQDCGSLTAPTNGIVDLPATTWGSVATYSCDAGYTLTGSATRTCQNTDMWDGSAPTCDIKDCGPLSNPTDGSVDVTGGTTYNQVATYTCNTGYTLQGGTTRTCGSDGQWTATAPTCTAVDCGNLVNPSNGLVVTNDGTTYGDTATYMCNVGYNLDGSSTRTCAADGTWTNSAPVCTPKDCGSPSPITNGVYSVTTTTFGSTVTYSCNTNYGIVGTATISCLSTGAWDTNLPTCAVDCGVPVSITGGTVSYSGGTALGAQASYTCNAGYTMSGGSTITCQADGSWSTGPTCLANLNGYNSACSSASDCQTTSASCLDDGTGTLRCLCTSTTVYDSNQDSCLADCGGLSNPTNGVVVVPTQTTEGQIATYTCNAGYAVSGSDSRMCQSSGMWSGSTPNCTIGCAEPDPPLNGMVNTSAGFISGASVTYSCDSGYALVGSTSRICLKDTTWSGQAPTCNKECSVLTDVTHGTVDLSLGNWADSVATYICDKNYALVGQSTRTCQSTGLWSGVQPTCLFAMFPDILIVFGVFIILLILVDIVVIGLFLYYYVYKAKPEDDEEKDDDDEEPEEKVEEKNLAFLPYMVERPDDGVMPPPMFMHAAGRKSKYTKIAPEVTEDPEFRMRAAVHPPPKKPPLGPLKVEKIDRPPFLKTPRNKKMGLTREKTFESTTFGPGKDRFKSDGMPKPPENTFLSPNSVVQPASKERIDQAEELYGGHSDDSNHRRAPSPAEADQLSLDDFDIPEPKANSTMDKNKIILPGPSFQVD